MSVCPFSRLSVFLCHRLLTKGAYTLEKAGLKRLGSITRSGRVIKNQTGSFESVIGERHSIESSVKSDADL